MPHSSRTRRHAGPRTSGPFRLLLILPARFVSRTTSSSVGSMKWPWISTTLMRFPPTDTSRRAWPKAVLPAASIPADAPARALTKSLRFGITFTRRVDNTGDRQLQAVGSRQSTVDSRQSTVGTPWTSGDLSWTSRTQDLSDLSDLLDPGPLGPLGP